MNRPLIPSLSPSDGERAAEGRVRGWFMVPMHAQKRKGAFHEPPPPSPPSPPSEGERDGVRGPPGSSRAPCAIRVRGGLPTNPEEHPTSNIQRRTSNGSANPRSLRRSVFDVGCSMLDVRCFPRFRGLNSRIFISRKPLPARHERSEGHLSLNWRELIGAPLPYPLPTPPSWGEGIDRRHGGGVFPLDTQRLALEIAVGCGGKPAAAWRTHRAKPHDDHAFI